MRSAWTINCGRLLPRIVWWFIVAIYLLFLFPSPEFPPYNADDGSFFISLGWNLSQYGRYTVDSYPVAEYGHHATWPPLFPMLLATIVKAVGLNWAVLKLTMVVAGLGALLLLRRLWSGEKAGYLAVLLTALNPVYFLFSHHPMTEVVYLFFVVATLLAIDHAHDSRTAFMAGLIAVLAFYTRGYAVVFLPAGCLYFLCKTWPLRVRLICAFTFVTPIVIAVAGWMAYTGHVLASQPLDLITEQFGNGSTLLESVTRAPADYLRRFYWNDLRYLAHLLLPVVPLQWAMKNDLALAIPLIVLPLAIYGWTRQIRERSSATEFWFPLAVAMLLIQSASAARYWLTFLPFLFYYFTYGVYEIGRERSSMRALASAITGILMVTAGAALIRNLGNPDPLRFVSPAMKDFRDVALWARDSLPAGSIVLTPFPNRFLAASGLRSRLPEHADASDFAALENGEPYLVTTKQGSGTHQIHCYPVGDPEHVAGAYAIRKILAPRREGCEEEQ